MIKVVIEPNEKLKNIAKEVMGFNIFDEEVRTQAYLGIASTNSPVLKPNDEGRYSINFGLGTLIENPEIRIAPSEEQLNKLEENAMDATLVISIGGE